MFQSLNRPTQSPIMTPVIKDVQTKPHQLSTRYNNDFYICIYCIELNSHVYLKWHWVGITIQKNVWRNMYLKLVLLNLQKVEWSHFCPLLCGVKRKSTKTFRFSGEITTLKPVFNVAIGTVLTSTTLSDKTVKGHLTKERNAVQLIKPLMTCL